MSRTTLTLISSPKSLCKICRIQLGDASTKYNSWIFREWGWINLRAWDVANQSSHRHSDTIPHTGDPQWLQETTADHLHPFLEFQSLSTPTHKLYSDVTTCTHTWWWRHLSWLMTSIPTRSQLLTPTSSQAQPSATRSSAHPHQPETSQMPEDSREQNGTHSFSPSLKGLVWEGKSHSKGKGPSP